MSISITNKPQEELLSVSQAAKLCGICRTTVNYWIRSKKIYAHRTGKKYWVAANELISYLNKTGKIIPDGLKYNNLNGPSYREIMPCWEYWNETSHGVKCPTCITFLNNLTPCFSAKESSRLRCTDNCNECEYYKEIYLPRISFIHQIESPVAVYKDLFLWGGNKQWALLCGVPLEDLPGMGFEKILHKDSINTLICDLKNISIGEPVKSKVVLEINNSKRGNKIQTRAFRVHLNSPSGAILLIAN